MDKYTRFLRNLVKGEKGSPRNRRRLMQRELNKLNGNDRKPSGILDEGGDEQGQ